MSSTFFYFLTIPIFSVYHNFLPFHHSRPATAQHSSKLPPSKDYISSVNKKPQIMSYKVKSLIYLICFVVSVVIYGQMESSMNEPTSEEMQLVQTQAEDLDQDTDKPL
ncbi:MAG: hypothetical protein KJO16_06660 [Muriicola sp.]|nr:hypothetical protein [Muriicola sp.]MBT8282301.1 hypothetical protein [Muriicola sp.]